MRQTHHSRKETNPLGDCAAQGGNRCDGVRQALARIRENILREFSPLAQEHAHVLRLALNEAEALAWNSGFPHLFFHELAAEKAAAAVQWHQRQRHVRRRPAEMAFAE